jgi:hypothetical protein
MVVLPDGSFWVADAIGPRLLAFSPKGEYEGEVGGRGEGPGEFESIAGIGTLPDGDTAVWDPQLFRVTVFDASGNTKSTFSASGIVAPGDEMFRTDTAGSVWILGRVGRGRAFRRFTADGMQDVVPLPDPEPEGPLWVRQHYASQSMHGFTVRTLPAMSPHGYLLTGRNDSYTLSRPLRDGRTVSIRLSADPIQVARAEAEAYQARENRFAGRRGARPGRVPDVKPPFWHLWVDQDGRYWVALHGEGFRLQETAYEAERRERMGNPPLEWWEARQFDIIEPSGRWLARLELPVLQSQVLFSRHEQVWVLERGRLDEEELVHYQIITTGRR